MVSQRISLPRIPLLKGRAPILLLAAMVFPVVESIGITVTLEPVKDTTIFSENGGKSSALGDLFVGKTNGTSGTDLRRALLAFNIEGNIPAGAVITSVTLTMRVEKISRFSAANIIAVHKLSQDWGEGSSNSSNGRGSNATANDATWSHRFFNTSNTWNVSGGDFSSTVSGSLNVSSTGTKTWNSTVQMVADVQDWLDNPTSNFGWILSGGESSPGSAKRFTSREGSASVRPKLTVEFTPPTNRQRWLDAHFSLAEQGMPEVSGDSVDLSGDGIKNLLAYAFDLNPHLYQPEELPQPAIDDSGFLSLIYIRDTRADDLIYIVEASSDLSTWTEMARSAGGAAPTGSGTISETTGATTRTVTVSDTEAGSERFIRLIVERQE